MCEGGACGRCLWGGMKGMHIYGGPACMCNVGNSLV